MKTRLAPAQTPILSQPHPLELALGQVDEININLLCTRRCNYQCAHCMYAAGPHLPGAWLSWEDLQAIRGVVLDFKRAELNVTINLVGGEPTLDFQEFSRILETVCDWEVSLEMTTNGWWLHSWPTVCEFARAVVGARRRHDLAIRISNSVWHDPFRAKSLLPLFNHAKPTEHLRDRLESPCEYYDSPTITCPNCSNPWESGPEQEYWECKCGHSSEQDWNEQSSAAWDIPGSQWVPTLIEAIDEHQLYIDTRHRDLERVSPVGRAIKLGGWQDGSCHATNDVKFTFQPGATIYDPCCNGGKVPLGSAHDGGFYLFAMRHAFMQSLHQHVPLRDTHNSGGGARCLACPKHGQAWLRQADTIKAQARTFQAYMRDRL